ncbi:MAG: hypothetical protein BRC33_09565 [Cyanobacteria bacterium SW_9_44_58]|nr:MAG: hypothetical protein BRC33_09565 [Cyanobacteria bacterium SW_9_44_58]
MEEFILSILEFFGQAWWVEVKTESPRCTYYFGPFLRKREAEKWKPGYVEDLEGEGAEIVSLAVKRCKPAIVTDYEEHDEPTSEQLPSFSGSREVNKAFRE